MQSSIYNTSLCWQKKNILKISYTMVISYIMVNKVMRIYKSFCMEKE